MKFVSTSLVNIVARVRTWFSRSPVVRGEGKQPDAPHRRSREPTGMITKRRGRALLNECATNNATETAPRPIAAII